VDLLHAMRVYARVARLGSFSRAADDLALSRAAVSESVAALEARLGARLLTRTTRRVSVTPEGLEYLARSERILGEVEAAAESVRGLRERPRGRLRVDVPTAFGRLLVPALPQFLQRYPEIELDVRYNDRVVDLVAERIDVAMRVGIVKPPSYVARRIATTWRVVVAAPAYLTAHGRPSHPDELRRHRLVALSDATTGRVRDWSFRGVRVRGLRYAVTVNQAGAQVAAALAGVGLAQNLDLLVGELVGRGRLATVLEPCAPAGPPVSLVSPAALHESARVRAFAGFAAELLLRWRERLAGIAE
jgi:LysR family transcriptional regulator, regulator for bpeEF and oprC